jgi:mannan endo-1,4-beta-mannosidase
MITKPFIIRTAKGLVWMMRMNTMRLMRIAPVILAAALGGGATAQTVLQSSPEPVNPHATPEARALLGYIQSISGQAIVTGQHNYPNDGSRWTDLAYDLTGKYPGLFGQDFGFSAGDDKDSVLSLPAMIEEVERQYRNGAVIALTWHEVRPTDDEPVTFHDSVQGHLTDYEWKELLTPGSPLNNRWCAQVDVVAGYLAQLRDAHVPVLFRAYHEMNGNWFWWSGRPGKDGSAELYRMIYDRFVKVHHLDNLVWVWNVNAPSVNAGTIGDYFPGAQFADVVTMDIYGEFKQSYYTSMLDQAAGKPIALAEVGWMPSPEVLEHQPRWTYLMTWSEFIHSANTLEQANALYHSPRALNRDDPRLAEPMKAIRNGTAQRSGGLAEAEPVSPKSTSEAKVLLARLRDASGKTLLSGQQNGPNSQGAETAAVVQVTGKCPAIYGVTLLGGVPNPAKPGATEVSGDLVQELLRAHAGGADISLTWLAPRPTDNAQASPGDHLTDFEWNELLTPGSALNQRWCAQVDEAAETMKALQKSQITVLWNPYPESNGNNFRWAGRKGNHGSAELYRQLFDRLVNHNGLHNLVWVWEAGPPDFGPGGAGLLSDFFPGLLYTDGLEIRLNQIEPWFRAGDALAQIAVGKVIGVALMGDPPPPDALTNHSSWAWFMGGVQPVSATRDAALRRLYDDPRIVSLTPR